MEILVGGAQWLTTKNHDICVSGDDTGSGRRGTARQKRSGIFDCEYFKHF